MASNNVFFIIFILLVIGIIVYFYYNYQGDTTTPEDNKVVLQNTNINRNRNRKRKTSRTKQTKSKAKSTAKKIQASLSSSYRPRLNKSKINVDDIFENTIPLIPLNESSEKSLDYPLSLGSPASLQFIDSEEDLNNDIYPSNLDQTDPEALWDATFGLPLMSKEEKKKFASKLQNDHRDYTNSLSKFAKYQTDDSTLIKTDITINPFKESNSKCLSGKAIKDIYDEQVAGPKAIPKRIQGKTATSIIYEDEMEMNGGQIKGTNLYGFDGTNDGYKLANFGNEF